MAIKQKGATLIRMTSPKTAVRRAKKAAGRRRGSASAPGGSRSAGVKVSTMSKAVMPKKLTTGKKKPMYAKAKPSQQAMMGGKTSMPLYAKKQMGPLKTSLSPLKKKTLKK